LGASSAVLDALRESHEDRPDEDCSFPADCDDEEADGFVSGLESVASFVNSSRNFWISGSAAGSLGVDLLESAVDGLSSVEADGFEEEGEVVVVVEEETQSQPIVMY
jgi:hypothetical protein